METSLMNEDKVLKNERVTLIQVLVRLILIFSPVILPQIYSSDKWSKIFIPFIWFMSFIPVFLCPHRDYEQWDKSAKPFAWIFSSIAYLYLFMLVGWGVMFIFFGKIPYS